MPLPKCVRVDLQDSRSAESLLKDGWREIEVLDIWYREAKPIEVPEARNIRRAKPGDLPGCVWIAQTSFTDDRLHRDPGVDPCEADREKGKWVERAFEQNIKNIFVSYDKGVNGFLIIQVQRFCAVVDLIAVHRKHRKNGIASALLTYAIFHYGLDMRAGTQSRNTAAANLYVKHGFELMERRRTFHK